MTEPSTSSTRPSRAEAGRAISVSAGFIGAVSAVTGLLPDSRNVLLAVVYVLAATALVGLIGFMVVRRRRTVQVPVWANALYVSVVISMMIVVVWVRATPADPDPTPPTEEAACRTQQTAATLEPGRDDADTDLRLTEASYTLRGGENLGLRWSGRVAGKPDPGSALYLAGTADPTTKDSTPQHNPGASFYFLLYRLDPDGSGCWTTPQRDNVAYSCVSGITFVYHLISVDATKGKELYDQQQQEPSLKENGYPPGDFESLPLRMLQSFRVETPAITCS